MLFGSIVGCQKSGNKDSETEIKVLLDSKDRTLLQPLLSNFSELYPEYDLNVIWTPGDDIQTNQGILIGSRSAPDVVIGGSMYTKVYENILLPLDDLIERDKEEIQINDIFDGIMETLTTEDENTIFMPRYFNISLLYYNKDLFDASSDALKNVGLEFEGSVYPNRNWTIEDFFTAGEILTKTDPSGNYVQWGSTQVRAWWGEWLIHVNQAGGKLFDENGSVVLDSEEAIAGMQVFHDKVYGNSELGRGKISAGAGQSDFGGLEGGKTAMEYGGHTANWARFDQVKTLNWGVELLPTGMETRTGGEIAVDGIGIHKDSKNVEGAWKFIKFLTNPIGIQTQVDLGYAPVRQSILDNMEEGFPKERAKLAMEAIQYGIALPTYEYFTDVAINYIESEISNMMARPSDSHKKSIVEALQDATKNANNYIDLNYR